MQMGWEVSFLAMVLNVVAAPLEGGGPTISPKGPLGEMVVTLFFSLVLRWRDVSAWCEVAGVVEGYRCFLVVERFLEGCGEV